MNPHQATGTPVPEILPPLDAVPLEAGAIAVAGIVHDLGNLIQIATSAINILLRAPEMPAVHAGPLLHRARLSLDHAGAIVRQNLARFDAAPADPCDLAASLADVGALVGALDAPGLRLEIEAAGELPAALCDGVGLRRALLNLVLNARDAMAGNGTVRIEARPGGATVDLSVVDHGIGMSPDTIARAFDPGFTTKRDGLGGIGLPMVAAFARHAGGIVRIDSAPGTGTAVTLRLPVAPPDRTPKEI